MQEVGLMLVAVVLEHLDKGIMEALLVLDFLMLVAVVVDLVELVELGLDLVEGLEALET